MHHALVEKRVHDVAPAVVPEILLQPVELAGRWNELPQPDRARAVIKDAAATSKTVQHTRIEVNGYADTSGTPKYNMGLSMRRAQAVAEWYAKAEPEERRDMWLLMCEQFAPDATRFKSARQRYEAAARTAEEGQAEISLSGSRS